MPDGLEGDVVRLSLPADAAMRPVVEVAVAVLGRRLRFDDTAIAAARASAGAALDDVTGTGGQDTSEIEILVREDRLVLDLRNGAEVRTITILEGASGR